MESGKLQYPSHQKLLKTTGIAFMALGLILFLFGYFEIADLNFFAYFVGGFGFFIFGYIYKVAIDPGRGNVKVTKGFLIPFVHKEYHKSDFHKVNVRKEVIRNSNQNSSPGTSSFSIKYAVVLLASDTEVRIDSFNRLDEAFTCKNMLENKLDIPQAPNEVLEEKRKTISAKVGLIILLVVLGGIGWGIYLAMTV